MSWQLLIPVVEKIIDAGIEYYNSEASEQSQVADQPAAISSAGASILLAVEFPGTEEDLREKLEEALSLVDGLEVVAMEVKKDDSGA